jgi:large subunit ribosomal protein L10
MDVNPPAEVYAERERIDPFFAGVLRCGVENPEAYTSMSDTATQRSPRVEKVAIVEEISGRLASADAVFVAEYRGLSVTELAVLRNALRPVGAEMKVYKNTLARRAANEADRASLVDLLTGPTALTFATGDIAAAAKALVDATKANPLLVVRGGLLGEVALSDSDVKALASLPSREEMLAKFAGLLQAPLVKTAGLLQALPRNFAYGLSALVDQRSAA